MKNASVSISRPRGGSWGEDYVQIRIRDDDSGLNLIEVKLTMEDYAYIVTGLSEVKGKVTRIIGDKHFHKLGKKKETKHIGINVEGLNKWDVREKIEEDPTFLNSYIPFEDGWELWDDGCRSQQNGGHHNIVICRYVEIE